MISKETKKIWMEIYGTCDKEKILDIYNNKIQDERILNKIAKHLNCKVEDIDKIIEKKLNRLEELIEKNKQLKEDLLWMQKES